jgi:hypothetical protein
MKKFNTAGPSVAEDHFMIDPLVRIDIEDIESLMADKRYFVLHAPRQTGKTTCLLALMQHLNAPLTPLSGPNSGPTPKASPGW